MHFVNKNNDCDKFCANESTTKMKTNNKITRNAGDKS